MQWVRQLRVLRRPHVMRRYELRRPLWSYDMRWPCIWVAAIPRGGGGGGGVGVRTSVWIASARAREEGDPTKEPTLLLARFKALPSRACRREEPAHFTGWGADVLEDLCLEGTGLIAAALLVDRACCSVQKAPPSPRRAPVHARTPPRCAAAPAARATRESEPDGEQRPIWPPPASEES